MVCCCNSFFTVCPRSKTVQTYLSRTHRCDAARALLGEQYGAAFLTSASNRSYRHTMTALITSLHSQHLGSPQWCPFTTRSLSLRCPFKRGTKTAVSAPDLLTLNLVLCARASSASNTTAGSRSTIGLVSRVDLSAMARSKGVFLHLDLASLWASVNRHDSDGKHQVYIDI